MIGFGNPDHVKLSDSQGLLFRARHAPLAHSPVVISLPTQKALCTSIWFSLLFTNSLCSAASFRTWSSRCIPSEAVCKSIVALMTFLMN